MDGYNSWFLPTSFPSFRYANDKSLNSHIPPKDLALVRLFHKFDGHKLRQGVKFVTTSHYRQFNHTMTPDMIDWFKGYDYKVPNLTLDEFRDMITFKTYAGVISKPYH